MLMNYLDDKITVCQIMLFDVVADPAETREVSKANPDVVKTMLDRLEYYQSRVSRAFP